MSRAKWKGVYINIPKNFKKRDINNKLIISRNSEIIPKFVGLTFSIHNGKDFYEIIVTDKMVGHKFGEFFFTRSKFFFKKKKSKK